MRVCTYLDGRQRERCTECGVTVDLCLCPEVSDIAQERIASPAGRFLRDVMSQVETADSSRRLFEKIVQEIGNVGTKLVSNSEQGTPETEEVYRNLVRLGALLTLLAADGTPEYVYPRE